MYRRFRLAAAIAALTCTSVVAVADPNPVAAHPACPAPVVTADRPGVYGTTPPAAFDGNEVSFFWSNYDDWQYVQVDFGCVSTFSGLRRKMGFVRPHDRAFAIGYDGERSWQGESVSYSVDGVQWTHVTHASTSGWEGYVPYSGARDAWHSVEYGWSEELRLNVPAQARYVRFHWDGDKDVLNELDIDVAQADPLDISLSCLRGEATCSVTATGGHPGGYSFAWATTGVFGGQQYDGSSSSSYFGKCLVAWSFTVSVTVTDSHGRTASDAVRDRCALPF